MYRPVIALALLIVVAAGCLFPQSQSLRKLAASSDSYSITIDKEEGATNIRQITSNLTSLFIEFGCDSALVATCKGTDGTYKATMVSFMESKGALGAFYISSLPGAEPLEIGYAGRKTDSVVEFVKHTNLISIKPEDGSDISGALLLAEYFAEHIQGATLKPRIYDFLPTSNRIEGTELYFMGPHGFETSFSEQLADDLHIGGAVDGGAADYNINSNEVTLLKIRYAGRLRTLEAVDSYLVSHRDLPTILPRESLQMYTVIERDGSEVYIAEQGDWLFMMLDAPAGGDAQQFFEYLIRGGS